MAGCGVDTRTRIAFRLRMSTRLDPSVGPFEGRLGHVTTRTTATLAIRGAKWTTLGAGVQRAIQMASIVVLARMLTPEEFGLIAIATVVLTLVKRFKTLGLFAAYVQHQRDDDRIANTFFTFHGMLNVVALLVVLAIVPLVSALFGEPEAGLLLAAMALRMLPECMTDPCATRAVKNLEFRIPAVILVVEAMVTASVSIVLASKGWGAWSVAIGSVTGAGGSAVLWWILTSWRPRIEIDWRRGRSLMRVGAHVWAAGNLAYLVEASTRMIIGRFLGTGALGFYEVTSKLVHFPLHTLISIHDRVAMPVFCREQDDLARLRNWFLRVTSLMTVLTALVAGVLFFLSDHLIPVVFGGQWTSAIGPAQALAPFAFVLPLLTAGPILIACGRTDLALRFTAVRAVTTVSMLVVAAHFSLVAVCAVESLAACIFAPVNLALVAMVTRMSPIRMLKAFDLPAVGLVAFSVTAIVTRNALGEFASTPGLPALAALAAPPVAAFVLAVFARRPRILNEIREVAVTAFGSQP